MKNSGKTKRWLLLSLAVALLAVVVIQTMNRVDANQPAELRVVQENNQFALESGELGTFHRTARKIHDARLINLPETNARIVLWNEETGSGSKSPFYAVSLDGKTVNRVQETSYEMQLRYGKFDPLVETPATPENLTARADGGEGAYIVQFVTQPLDEYSAAIKALGGKTYIYLPNHSYIVKMNAETRQAVENLPFVRWVGDYQPAYKIEEFISENLANRTLEATRYNIMVLDRGAFMQNKLAGRIGALGGKVEMTTPQGFRMEATLTAEQLVAVANESDVLFVDRWSAPETDMDIVREVGGANFIETTLGFKGQGVRAEVMDAGFLTTHTDFNSGLAPIIHGTVNVDSHGTATYGINFARGTANPLGRGMLPEAQGIMASYNNFVGGNRYTHTAQLKQDPYRAVYQSNSWGSSLTTAYNTISAEMDDILFKEDFLLLNSQSNAGSQSSRPQAWSKNVVSIGGISHLNTASFDDDRWTSASVGPAADGRIKPELAHFYDNVFTTTSSSTTAYTGTFNGTSSATPITAGHFGIFFQMWHNGVFGNPTAATVFDSRPHMTTAKAVMINTATQWTFGGSSTSNTTRVRQGFGRADLKNLYNLRGKMLIVDETDVLTNLQSKTYTVNVPAGGADPLKVTMTYADPMGSPSATRARINDLTLKVTAPDGTVYWGNNGLLDGMWSTSGGTANVIDTVENVFVQTPAAGAWTVEVIASELVADARTETPSVVDADYALVVSGIVNEPRAPRVRFDFDGDGKADVSVFRPSSGTWYLLNSQSGFGAAQFGASTDRIVPADYDADGKADIAVYRGGTWYLLRSQSGFAGLQFGTAEDVPVPADYDGDGQSELAVFRPSNNTWYIYNFATNQASATVFGQAGDKPVVADYDGDGKANIAVFRPANRTWYTSTNPAFNYGAVQFGEATDKLVPADYDGDNKADVAVFRPSNGAWYLLRSSLGFTGVQFGLGTDAPAPADYDGDGRTDIAVFRDGTWYLLRSQAGFTGVAFGIATDKAIPNAFVP